MKIHEEPPDGYEEGDDALMADPPPSMPEPPGEPAPEPSDTIGIGDYLHPG